MIQYNKSIMQFFKDQGLALATLADVELGVTYYSNSFSVGADGFQISRLLSDKEHWEVWANHVKMPSAPISTKTDKIAWFQIDGANGPAWHSLTDCNVGASYNPWMIFRTKDALEAYNKLQMITYERDYLDEMFEDAYEYED